MIIIEKNETFIYKHFIYTCTTYELAIIELLSWIN